VRRENDSCAVTIANASDGVPLITVVVSFHFEKSDVQIEPQVAERVRRRIAA
jgi:hypothetical protein